MTDREGRVEYQSLKTTGLTTQVFIKTIVTSNKVNDSPMTDREGGVENQSKQLDTADDGLETTRTNLTDNGFNIENYRVTDREGVVDNQSQENDTTDNGPVTSWTNLTENGKTSYECNICRKTFGTEKGVKIHLGRKCKKKGKHRSSSGRKTSNNSSQETNHSGSNSVTAEASSSAGKVGDSSSKKPKVMWPTAKEKAKYKSLEEKVCKDLYKMRGTTKAKLVKLANSIYNAGKELFGVAERKKKERRKGGKSRRERRMEELRKEKQELKKKWRKASPEEVVGLKALHEDLKKKCRTTQRSIRRLKRRKESRRARKQFLDNPYEEAKKLFTEARSGTLKCSKEELDRHLNNTYSDKLRNQPLSPIDGLKHPTKPGVGFQLGGIREREVDDFVRKARGKSGPGGDGVSYKVYKYCDRLRHKLFLLLRQLWREGDIVDEWCKAEGVYLPKEAEAEDIGQFRPISLLNVDGKIYMGILAKRTVNYLQTNGYIDESVQKAGIPGIPGCIEHAFSIWDVIQEAKTDNLDLSVVWLDLANAYGSVPHELLFTAMDHFHIPVKVKDLMRKYYNNFTMRFTTAEFTTDWHRLEVGIAAGCTISVIWFVLVMEMILMSTECTEESAKIRSPKKAFMDDVTILTRGKDRMAKVLTRLDQLITWSRMKFKAKKSRSLTFLKGRQKEVKFTIAGELMPTVKEKPVKSLGRWYEGTLSDRSRGIEIQRQAEEGLKSIDKTKLPGKYKVWCLQFALYPRLAWPLMIYEVALSRVEIIEQKCSLHIRKWLGLPRITNSSALYRKSGAFHLPITSIVEIYKTGKVRTVMMLKESRDNKIRENPPVVRTARKWVAEEEVEKALLNLEHRDIVGSAQNDRSGLGVNKFKPFSTMTRRERRRAVGDEVKDKEAERREVHLIQCCQQGQMTRWVENVVERKISWNEIWKWTTSRLSFLIRATYDVLPSPVNLVRWKIQDDDKCKCGKVGTMKHILSNCRLNLDRYTWRHNEVLRILYRELNKVVEEINDGKKPQRTVSKRKIVFVRPGQKSYYQRKEKSVNDEKWNGVWEVSADLDDCRKVFPIPTSKKPDIFLWCTEAKVLHLVELTVPHEDNIDAAKDRKDKRYSELLNECEEAGWTADHFSIEVGCRGFVGNRMRKWLSVIGLPKTKRISIIKEIQETVEKASHWIWLKRNDEWMK